MDSKKLLVLSDTHGNLPALKAVLDWAQELIPPNGTICAAAFCGDGIADLKRIADTTGFYSDWKYVRGNNEYEPAVQESTTFDFAGSKFFMCHGHRHNVYDGCYSLINAGRSNEAEVVLFGHTHVPFQKTANGILLVNPGSVGRARSRFGTTFAVIECEENKTPKVQFWSISDRGEIGKTKLT